MYGAPPLALSTKLFSDLRHYLVFGIQKQSSGGGQGMRVTVYQIHSVVDSLLYCQYLKTCLNVLCQDPTLEAIGSGHETKEGD